MGGMAPIHFDYFKSTLFPDLLGVRNRVDVNQKREKEDTDREEKELSCMRTTFLTQERGNNYPIWAL